MNRTNFKVTLESSGQVACELSMLVLSYFELDDDKLEPVYTGIREVLSNIRHAPDSIGEAEFLGGKVTLLNKVYPDGSHAERHGMGFFITRQLGMDVSFAVDGEQAKTVISFEHLLFNDMPEKEDILETIFNNIQG